MTTDAELEVFSTRLKQIESCFEPVTAKLFNFIVINDSSGTQPFVGMVDNEFLKEKITEIITMEKPSLNKKKSKWVNSPIFKTPEIVRFSNEENGEPVSIMEKYRCQTCDLLLCNFEHYFFHVFGFAHSVKKKNFLHNSNKRLSTDPWESLLEYAYQNGIKLSEIKFSNFRHGNNQYEVVLEIFGQEFRQCGSKFKDMRLSVIQNALIYAENNLSKPLRKVRIPYIKGVERPAVLIDNVTESFLETPPRPCNDNPSIPVETVAMSFIDYIGGQIASEERKRHQKFFLDVYNKVHTADRGAYCDLCKNRFSAANVITHLTLLSHFRKTLHLPHFRRLKEISLVTGKDMQELITPADPHRVYRKWIFHFRAPESLLCLESKYFMYYCAFCDIRLKTEYALELHNTSNGHKNKLKLLDVRDERENLERIRDRINLLLIPEEFRSKDLNDVTQMPEHIRNRFLVEPLVTLDMVKSEIQKLDSNVKGAVEKLRQTLELKRISSSSKRARRHGRRNRKRPRRMCSLIAKSKAFCSRRTLQREYLLRRNERRLRTSGLSSGFVYDPRNTSLYESNDEVKVTPKPLLGHVSLPLLSTPKPYSYHPSRQSLLRQSSSSFDGCRKTNTSPRDDAYQHQMRDGRGIMQRYYDAGNDESRIYDVTRKRSLPIETNDQCQAVSSAKRFRSDSSNDFSNCNSFAKIKIDYGFGLSSCGPVSSGGYIDTTSNLNTYDKNITDDLSFPVSRNYDPNTNDSQRYFHMTRTFRTDPYGYNRPPYEH